MEATYKKLKSGAWGALVKPASAARDGAQITVTKRDGTRKAETIEKVVWRSGDGSEAICALASSGQQAPRRGTRWSGRGQEEERGFCDECGEKATPGTNCWETGAKH